MVTWLNSNKCFQLLWKYAAKTSDIAPFVHRVMDITKTADNVWGPQALFSDDHLGHISRASPSITTAAEMLGFMPPEPDGERQYVFKHFVV